MGHPSVRGRSPLGELIASERQRRSLSRRELADLVRKADRTLRTNEKTVRRWEWGDVPQPATLRALAVALGHPVEDLAALVHPAEDGPPDATIETFNLASADLDWRSLVPDLRQSADRLCRLYATRPPAELVPRVQQRLGLIQRLLHDDGRRHQGELVETAGWLYLLLAALHGGLWQAEAAWASRDAGLRLGLELGHGDLIGWSYETAAWLSQIDGLWGDVLEAGEEGVRRSPPRSSALVQSLFKVAHAAAALRDLPRAESALEAAAGVVAGMDPAERPEHHFQFDTPKFDKFAANIYAEMGLSTKAAEHARTVIARSDDPTNPARFHPMRVMGARADLASALLDQGELDEACSEAQAALGGPFVISETVRSVSGLLMRMRERYPKESVVADLDEVHREARAAAYPEANV